MMFKNDNNNMFTFGSNTKEKFFFLSKISYTKYSVQL